MGPENSRVTMCQSEEVYQFVDLKVQTGIRKAKRRQRERQKDAWRCLRKLVEGKKGKNSLCM